MHRLILISAMVFVAAPLLFAKAVTYELRFPNAIHHEAEIRAVFTGLPGPPLEVRMSRSSPGRYALHDFAKNVYHVRAVDENGRPLSVARPDPYGWTVSGHHGSVVFDYTLFANYLDGTYSAIDETHAHLNLPATLVWARGFEQVSASLHFDIPARSNWRVATQLAPQPDGSWSAPSLEMLMDGPVEIGAHAQPEWRIGDAVFRLAIHSGASDAEVSAFAENCRKVVLEEAAIFGGLPRYDTGSYTFLIDYLPWAANDGMEHRDSTVITGSGTLKDAAATQTATAHEFFHSWNVTRIRPHSLEPFDFERADMSGELWFAEGFTNYYGSLALARAGLSPLDRFAASMGSAVNTVLTAPGRSVHNVIEMSRLAPFVDAARPIDPTNFSNTFISYYTYGQALALGIDLSIRSRFQGKTLDDWMRALWREHPDVDHPYTLDDLERTLGASVNDPSFAHDLFARHIYGLESLPYAPLLAQAGLLLRTARPGSIFLGSPSLEFPGDAVVLSGATLRDSTLYNAGLDEGDRILRWDGKSIRNSPELSAWLSKRHPGGHVQLDVRTRDGRARTAEAVLVEDPALELVPGERAGQPVTPEIRQFRHAWLDSRAQPPI